MGRGKHESSLQLVAASHEILEEIQPATVRAVCYRLFIDKLTPDMSLKSTRRVSKQLTWTREHGHIPWQWIVDETREAERASLWSDPQSYMHAVRRSYRKDLWNSQPYAVEVWSEKGTVRGTLAPVLNEYGVAFRVQHGFGSATSVHEAAEDSRNRFIIVLYVGDFDPSGMHMSEVDLPNRLERYGGEVYIRRIALRPADLPELPSFPAFTKSRDPRYRWFVERYGDTCWELDAMSPVVLRERVKAEIESHIDKDAWELAKRAEAAEVETIGHVLDRWSAICDRDQQ
jgi:hypothetical protein